MLHLPSQLGCICNAVASAVKPGPRKLRSASLFCAGRLLRLRRRPLHRWRDTGGGAVTDTPSGETVPDIRGGLAGGQVAMSRKTPLSADVGNSAGY